MSEVPRNAEIDVRIEENRLRVRLIIPADLPAPLVDVSLLTLTLQSRGVLVTPEVNSRLEELVRSFHEEQKRIEAIVAEAKPPVNGLDGRIDWQEGFDPDAKVAPPLRDDEPEAVDFYNYVRYVHVRKGDHLATLFEPTDGEDGFDVTGAVVKAVRGKPCPIKCDSTIELDPQMRVIAKQDGVLRVENNVVSIIRLLEVREHVDFNTGNIDFDGTVVIHQHVRDRFRVTATEDIAVRGLVEAAELNAGRNLTLQRGMAGKDRGHLVVAGDANIGFLNNVKARIDGSLALRREIINSEVVVGGDLLAEQACILGGSTIITGAATVAALGSDGDVRTLLILGAVPILMSHVKRLTRAVEELDENLEWLRAKRDPLMRLIDQLDDRDKARIEDLSMRIDALERKRSMCEAKREEFLCKAQNTQTVNLTVLKVIYSKTTLSVRGREYVFTAAIAGPISIGWNEKHQAFYRIANGPSQPLSAITREPRQAA